MNRLFFALVAICATFMLFSCNNEENSMTSFSKGNNDADVYPPQYFARVLALSLKDEALRDFIKEEAAKQKDGDYDILIAEVIDRNIGSNGTLRSGMTDETPTLRDHLKQNDLSDSRTSSITLQSVLKEIETNYPSLQIAVPNMENASWKEVVSGSSPFFVAFLPKDYKEGDDIVAYDQKGKEHLLDGREEPKTPVIVISESERITAIPASTQIPPKYKEMSSYYKNALYTYISEKYENAEPKNISFLRTGSLHTIRKAKFASQSAMRRYEPWTKGRPEVCVIISNNTQHIEHEFGDKGWWNGNTNMLNYQFTMDEYTYRDLLTHSTVSALAFIWYEKDKEVSFDKILSLFRKLGVGRTNAPIFSPKNGGVKINLILDPALLKLFEDHNDFIGSNTSSDPEKSSDGRLAAKNHPVHYNDFFFWID
jgi:lipoprotein